MIDLGPVDSFSLAELHKIEELRKQALATKTLRDQFAMAALTGLLASDGAWHAEPAAVQAYRCADAMLEARK